MSIYDQYETTHEFDVDIDGVRYAGTVDVVYDITLGMDDSGRPQPEFEFHPLGPVNLDWVDEDEGPGLLLDDDPRAVAILAVLDTPAERYEIEVRHRFPEEGDDA